jgi:polyisoprenyl-teichoic acid--peptidoglycan teichoic acid transferase
MSAALPSLSAGAAAGAARVRCRRALALVLMTVLLPGSAQLAAGNKRVGRVALRAVVVAVSFVALVALVGLVSPTKLVWLGTHIWFLSVLRFALIGYAVGWAYLLVDAWRLADPMRLTRGQRLMMTGLNGVLCFTISGALLLASHYVAVQRDFIQSVFGQTLVTHAEHGRYNVLLLGGDAGPNRVGLRPDSITVASVDEQTGRTVLFGLPRNLADVPFPAGTVMHRRFPHGFNCREECYLNAVNTWATDHANLFPGVKNPGIEATKEAVEAITGLHINYYVLIDLRGFQDLVDAVGGVTVNVPERIAIGGPTLSHISGWIKPGRRHLDGYQTLWFARSRATSDDYARMARQKCVMNAMLHQLRPQTVLAHFGAIAKAGEQVVSTSIPASQLGTFVSLALKARSLPVSTVSFVPPRIDTGAPDWRLIRTMVRRAIAASRSLDQTSAAPAGPHRGPRPRHHVTTRNGTGYAANESHNLANAC